MGTIPWFKFVHSLSNGKMVFKLPPNSRNFSRVGNVVSLEAMLVADTIVEMGLSKKNTLRGVWTNAHRNATMIYLCTMLSFCIRKSKIFSSVIRLLHVQVTHYIGSCNEMV